MTKRLLIVFLALGLTLYNSGCTSGGSKDDSEVASANDDSFAEEGEGDFAEESTDGESEGETTAEAETEGDSGSEGEASEQSGAIAEESALSEDDELSLNDETGDESEIADAEKPAEEESKQASQEGGGEDELSLEDDGLPSDVAGAKPADGDAASGSDAIASAEGGASPGEEPQFTGEAAQPTESTPTDTSVAEAPAAPSDDPGTSEVVASEPVAPPPAAAPAFLPVQKIKTEPFTKAGTVLNRVYIARPGDTSKSVSQKLYGQNRSKDLLKWNPHLNRGVKTGDKIYYSSPINPNDPQMLTYYEDIGAQPSVYTSKPGDNIRRVSKQLLGSSESWKEVWATNPTVENKGDIPGGLEIRYWPEGADAGVAAMMASVGKEQQPMPPNESLPPSEVTAPPPPTQAANGMPPDLGEDPFAENPAPPPPAPPAQDPLAAAPPPPPPDGAMAGTTAPPPVDPLAAPVEPPPPVAVPETKPVKRATAPASEEEVSPASDPDTLMAMAFGGFLLIAAAVLFVVIRKNRAKRMVDLGQTQV